MIIEFLKYHYADGTIDGTGENRMTVAEYKEKYQQEIDLINKQFNNKDFIIKIIFSIRHYLNDIIRNVIPFYLNVMSIFFI
mgnify:CR=1 FL=1